MKSLGVATCIALITCGSTLKAADVPPITDAAKQEAARLNSLPPVRGANAGTSGIDTTGRSVIGKASYYAERFEGRLMADGERFDPDSNCAASRTLPLGTTAKVINLDTGKSAIVTVQDRGPYVKGRVIDLTPKIARKLDMTDQGVAPVVVKPIAVPKPDGGVKLGAGAAEAPAPVVQKAIKTAEEAELPDG